MSMKRVVGAAAVAAGLSISMATLNAGTAYSAPLDPPPPCPGCHGGGGGGGNPGGPGGAPGGPGGQPGGHGGQQGGGNTPPQGGQNGPPAQGGQNGPPAQGGQNGPPAQGGQNGPPQGGQNAPQPNEPGHNPPQGGQTNAPANTQNPPGNERQRYASLNPPSTQPPHPPYIPPRGVYASGNAEIGGPVGLDTGFSVVGHGAPPPPRPHNYGWNDGPAPGHPPPHWVGPPPPGGWNGPPPPGGWNRPWAGPPRDVLVARADFGPFNYNTFTVVPVFNWQYGGWGYWFFGVWVPLY